MLAINLKEAQYLYSQSYGSVHEALKILKSSIILNGLKTTVEEEQLFIQDKKRKLLNIPDREELQKDIKQFIAKESISFLTTKFGICSHADTNTTMQNSII